MNRDINININIPSDEAAPQRIAQQMYPEQHTPVHPQQELLVNHAQKMSGQPVSEQQPVQQEPISEPISDPVQIRECLQNLVGKIKYCHSWYNFYQLREEFHNYGMSIEPTESGRYILCSVSDEGIPLRENIIDDYIFLGGKHQIDEVIDKKSEEIICNFIGKNAIPGANVKIKTSKNYQDSNFGMYGKSISIEEQKQLAESQDIHQIGKLLNE
jgi:hypothetical protein